MAPQIDKTGLPPGTVVYSGEEQTGKVIITLLEFNEKEFIESNQRHQRKLHIRKGLVQTVPLVTILIASKRIFNGVERHLDYSSNDESFSDRNVEESFTLRHNA